jgi:DNA topoisomerase-1
MDEAQTRPPARFSEAGLVQALERHGVGRPSTYASTVRVVQSKGYVTREQQRLVPTDSGVRLCEFLTQQFPQVFEVGYTARLEAALDRVAAGRMRQQDLLAAFWLDFQPSLKTATQYALAQVKGRPSPKPLVLHPREA